MLKGSNLVQLKRFLRIWLFSLAATLPAALASDEWWLVLLGSGAAGLEAAYRAVWPATPDVATSPSAAGDGDIPLLG